MYQSRKTRSVVHFGFRGEKRITPYSPEIDDYAGFDNAKIVMIIVKKKNVKKDRVIVVPYSFNSLYYLLQYSERSLYILLFTSEMSFLISGSAFIHNGNNSLPTVQAAIYSYTF